MGKWELYTANEIRPKGWLARQLQLQAQGLSGNLDKIWPDVRDSAWVGGDREGWERVPYWLDGFIPLAYLLQDADMIARAKRYIDAILERQQPDGWICPCTEERRPGYDTWAVLLISKVLTVYYECSRDERIPGVLYRVLKNYHTLLKDGTLHLFDWGKSRWYEGLIAIRFLYKLYPEAWLPELAAMLQQQGADYNEFTEQWKRPLNFWRQSTHIVNLAMMLKAEAVSCELSQKEYTDNAEYLYDILNRCNGTPVGLFTGDECLSGLSPIQGTELCAVVEQMYSFQLLYAFTGDEKWAERLEVLAFNALPATVSADMWTHQYVQMSNQIACQKFPGRSLFRTNNEEAHLFGLEPNYGCCTANFNQGWPKFVLSAFMHQGDTVISGIPVPSELKADIGHIVLDTEYPFENTFTYTVEAAAPFTLVIRVPSFAKNLTVDGAAAQEEKLVFRFAAGEKRTLRIAYETGPYLEKRPHGLNTVRCGSLVFSLPIRYEKKMLEYERGGVERRFPYCDYELVPVSDWSYAYCGGELTLQRRGVSDIPFADDAPPVTVRAAVKEIDWGLEDGFETVCAKVPQSTVPLSEAKAVELYPYGCARLRMTELPVVE